jgi:hypothetical protein
MPERYWPLADEAVVVRLANAQSSFLPATAVLPLPQWLEPTHQDIEEAQKSGRPPGITVWDASLTNVEQARLLSGKPEGRAFAAQVTSCKKVAADHARQIAIVADPVDEKKPSPGWEGHALIEGLRRPAGLNNGKKLQQDFLTDLIGMFREVLASGAEILSAETSGLR